MPLLWSMRTTIRTLARETPIALEDLSRYPRDGLSGAGAVEIRLTNLLGVEPGLVIPAESGTARAEAG